MSKSCVNRLSGRDVCARTVRRMRLNCIILSVGTPDDLAVARDWYESLSVCTSTPSSRTIRSGSTSAPVPSSGCTSASRWYARAPHRRPPGRRRRSDVRRAARARRRVRGPAGRSRAWGRRAATTDPTGHTVYVTPQRRRAGEGSRDPWFSDHSHGDRTVSSARANSIVTLREIRQIGPYARHRPHDDGTRARSPSTLCRSGDGMNGTAVPVTDGARTRVLAGASAVPGAPANDGQSHRLGRAVPVASARVAALRRRPHASTSRSRAFPRGWRHGATTTAFVTNVGDLEPACRNTRCSTSESPRSSSIGAATPSCDPGWCTSR